MHAYGISEETAASTIFDLTAQGFAQISTLPQLLFKTASLAIAAYYSQELFARRNGTASATPFPLFHLCLQISVSYIFTALMLVLRPQDFRAYILFPKKPGRHIQQCIRISFQDLCRISFIPDMCQHNLILHKIVFQHCSHIILHSHRSFLGLCCSGLL